MLLFNSHLYFRKECRQNSFHNPKCHQPPPSQQWTNRQSENTITKYKCTINGLSVQASIANAVLKSTTFCY